MRAGELEPLIGILARSALGIIQFFFEVRDVIIQLANRFQFAQLTNQACFSLFFVRCQFPHDRQLFKGFVVLFRLSQQIDSFDL